MTDKNKIALITGGSSGIGLAIAKRMTQQGAHVWILARRKELLEAALAELSALRLNSDQCLGMVIADISDFEAVEKALAEVKSQVGEPDYLFNCAGAAQPGRFEDLELDIFRWMINVNYLGTVYINKAVVPGMLARGSGHIINFSSLGGVIGIYGYTAYSGAKFAVRGFTDALRSELKPRGIRVSLVLPPDTDTPQLAYENQFKPAITREVAGLAKHVTADEVAKVVLRDTARGKYLIMPNLETKFWYLAYSLLGTLQYPIVDWIIANAVKKLEQSSTITNSKS